MSKIMQVSTYNGQSEAWNTPIDIGAKAENIELNNGNDLETTITEVLDDIDPALTLKGNPLNFDSKYQHDAVSTKIDLNPIQDLHGYDHPWAGGAGKNLLPMTVERIKSVNTSGTWSGNVYTTGGITTTLMTDDNNVIGIKMSGTSTGLYTFYLFKYITAQTYPNQMILSGCPSSGSTSTYFIKMQLQQTPYTDLGVDSGNEISVSVPDDGNPYQVIIRINENVTVNDIVFYPMLRLATATDPTFEPYTNICPISGRTQVKVEGCGKNLLPMTVDSLKAANTSGTWSGNAYTYNDVTFTILMDSNGNVTGIKANGTASAQIPFYIQRNYMTNVWKNMTINGCSSGSPSTYFVNANLSNDGSQWASEIDVFTGDKTIPNYDYIRINLIVRNGVAINNITFTPMIRLATESDDTFEPYTPSNDLTISLGQTVYGGTLDVEKGELVVDKIKKDESQLSFSYGSAIQAWYVKLSDVSTDDNNSHAQNIISNGYENISYYAFNADKTKIAMSLRGADKYLFVRNGSNTTTPTIDICYELATPTVIPLTPAQVHLLKGVNNISTDGDNITLVYKNNPYVLESDLNVATQNSNGLMSAADKTKVDINNVNYVGTLKQWNKLSLSEKIKYDTVDIEPPLGALKFSSDGPFILSVSSPMWNGTLEYSIDNRKTWTTWDGSQLSGTESQPVYVRGTNNSRITYYDLNGAYKWTFTGKYITGNIETLLDYQTVMNGQHPVMLDDCFAFMFFKCTTLITPPELPATALTSQCYCGMFILCSSLTALPELPATTVFGDCYWNMFNNCTSLKLSTTQTSIYQYPYRIPTNGTGTDDGSLDDMFSNTGGTFTGTPEINTTYYTDHEPV